MIHAKTVKARLGPKNELLSSFGVAPARKRVRRQAEPEPKPQA